MRVPSTQVQNNFGKYLKFVEANEEVIVTRKGRDVARILPCEPDTVREEAALYRTGGDRVTYEQFLELTEASEQRFELIDGVLYNLASPSFKHQRAVQVLIVALSQWFKGKPCTPLTSPFDITFGADPDNVCVVQPDLMVICDPDNRDEKDMYLGVPALVVEVLSPSTRGKDMLAKMDLYRRSGVQEYWIADPANEQVHIYQFADDDIANSKSFSGSAGDLAVSFQFVGLSVAVREIFGG